jgi:alpha-galactosidase
VRLDFALLDTDAPRAQAIQALFAAKLREWRVRRVRLRAVQDAPRALAGADVVIIAISTGRLEAMRHDLAIPEKYGIYHTVGDTAGPGGWSRALRNIPVFRRYSRLIRRYAPEACVLNYTNPMGALTKVLADEIGGHRVVGLCHGLFECYDVLRAIFDLPREEDIQVRFGGVNHFFWILDFRVRGAAGYPLLRARLRGRNLAELVKEKHTDAMGWSSDKRLTGELFRQYGYLPYVGDRHTCEFFGDYITSRAQMKRLKLVRTTIEEREQGYAAAALRIAQWTQGRKADWGPLKRKPSRETAADIIKAVAFNEGFCDVTNLANVGQIDNLPRGAVVETLGYVNAAGFAPLTAGPLPEPLRTLVAPHAEVQLQTVRAGLAGDLDEALRALAADPVCAHLPAGAIRRLGRELLEANRRHLPQFFRG